MGEVLDMAKDMIVYNKEYAIVLINEGFECVNIQPNRQNNKFIVYFFRDTPELQQRLKELK